jgi:hypothetical protein
MTPGDDSRLSLESLCDRFGQNVEQQTLGLRPLLVQFSHENTHEVRILLLEDLEGLQSAFGSGELLLQGAILSLDQRRVRCLHTAHVPMRTVTQVSL